MLYYDPGNAIVDKAELFQKIDKGEISELIENNHMIMSINKVNSSSRGNLSSNNFDDFNPIWIGKPPTILTKPIYTGLQNSDTINGIKLFNEMKYWTEVDNLNKELTKPDLDTQKNEELKTKREVLAKHPHRSSLESRMKTARKL